MPDGGPSRNRVEEGMRLRIYGVWRLPGELRLLRLPTVDDFGSNGQEFLAGLGVIAHQVEDLDGASVVHVPDNWLACARVEDFRLSYLALVQPFPIRVFI